MYFRQRISTSIEISFTPNTLSGLLLYLGPVDGSISMDYLYIALSGGLVELRQVSQDIICPYYMV